MEMAGKIHVVFTNRRATLDIVYLDCLVIISSTDVPGDLSIVSREAVIVNVL